MIVRRLDEDAFENRRQKADYLSSLREHFLPLKFAYIGRAAYTHDKLVRSKKYGLSDEESSLISSKLVRMIAQRDSEGINVVDVGSGNGMKATVVLGLLSRVYAHLNYLGIDYSSELQGIAKRRILAKFSKLDIAMYQTDFESSSFKEVVTSLRNRNNYPSLFLFLGHTLGNPRDRNQVISNIQRSMSSGDRLLIGVELYKKAKIRKILEHYRNETFRRAVFNPLSFAGLSRRDGLLEIVFDDVSRDVEVHFKPRTRTKILAENSSPIEFEGDDDLMIFLSHRFEMKELRFLLRNANLHVDRIALDRARSYALIMAAAK